MNPKSISILKYQVQNSSSEAQRRRCQSDETIAYTWFRHNVGLLLASFDFLRNCPIVTCKWHSPHGIQQSAMRENLSGMLRQKTIIVAIQDIPATKWPLQT
jgi:hypothetical protein